MQSERGPAAGTVTGDGEGSAQFLRGERTAVEPKAMAVLSGRESVAEDSGHVFRQNSDAVVSHYDADANRRLADAHGHEAEELEAP